MASSNSLDQSFDMLLLQTIRAGLTHAQIENGIRYAPFQESTQTKLRYGYRFRIPDLQKDSSSKKWFYFENPEEDIVAKLGFDGVFLENKKKPIPTNILSDLQYFLTKETVQLTLHQLWEESKNKQSL